MTKSVALREEGQDRSHTKHTHLAQESEQLKGDPGEGGATAL